MFLRHDPWDYPPSETKSGPEPPLLKALWKLESWKACGLKFCCNSKCEAEFDDFSARNHQSHDKTNRIPSSEVPPARLVRVWYIQLSCSSAGYVLCVLRLLRAGSVVLRGAAA